METETLKSQLEDFLKRLLAAARLDLQFEVRLGGPPTAEAAPELTAEFSGPDVDLLLQRGGELLEALEDVASRVLRIPQEDRDRITFDCMDYRSLRVEELRLTAETAAARVVSSGDPFHLNPMNSRERRIIHLALKEN